MRIHEHQDFLIYFGDAQDTIFPEKKEITKALGTVQERIGAQGLFFLKQVHGTDGVCIRDPFVSLDTRPNGRTRDERGELHKKSFNEITRDGHASPFVSSALRSLGEVGRIERYERTGDFIITDTAGLGIGVFTADCLPIVLYDEQHYACAVVHAGWRGAVNGIAARALDMMRFAFGTQPEHVRVYFGPSARRCCYSVGDDFYKNVPKYADMVLINGYFNNVLLNTLLLRDCGVREKNLYTANNVCTICDIDYWSYRRQGNAAGRQVTIVMLRRKQI